MKYLDEINWFYDWLETNTVSDSSIVLWHALMHMNNKSGWKQEFTVAISTLELKTGLSKSSIIRARNTLQQAGRIVFRSRSGQQSAIYSMIAFLCDTQSGTQTVTQTVTQSGTQTVPISKTRLEETRLDNSKSHSSGKPPAKEKKKEVITEPYWTQIIDAWFEFYGNRFKDDEGHKAKPKFSPAEGAHLKSIVKNLKGIAITKQKEWTEVCALQYVNLFFSKAYSDKWLAQHFELKNLLANFNSITNKAQKTNGQTKQSPSKVQGEIDYSGGI